MFIVVVFLPLNAKAAAGLCAFSATDPTTCCSSTTSSGQCTDTPPLKWNVKVNVPDDSCQLDSYVTGKLTAATSANKQYNCGTDTSPCRTGWADCSGTCLIVQTDDGDVAPGDGYVDGKTCAVVHRSFSSCTGQCGTCLSGYADVSGTCTPVNPMEVFNDGTGWFGLEADLSNYITYTARPIGGSSQWTTSGANIYNSNTGNVGIGTTTPGAKLHVNVPNLATTTHSYGGRFDNTAVNMTTDAIYKYGVYISSIGTFTGSSGAATKNWGLYIPTVNGADFNYGAYIGNNVGIGTADPDTALHVDNATNPALVTVSSNAANDKGVILKNDDNGNRWKVYMKGGTGLVSAYNNNGAGYVDKFYIDGPTGDVGIGTTTTPNLPLTVQGFTANSDLVQFRDTAGANKWHLNFKGGGLNFVETLVADNRLFLQNGGNVGIGTGAPTGLFQVSQPTTGPGTVATNGTVTLTGTGTQFLNTFKVGDTISVSGQTVRTIATVPSDTSLTVTVAFSGTTTGNSYTLTGGNRLTVLGNGNVGIGTTTPGAKLDVTLPANGSAIKTNGWISTDGGIYSPVSTLSTGFYGDATGMHIRSGGVDNQVSINTSGTLDVLGNYSMDGNVVIDNGGGWHRSYGNTGWYNGTYAGGWYMTDSTWIRAYNNKSVYTPANIQADGIITAGGGVNVSQGPSCHSSSLAEVDYDCNISTSTRYCFFDHIEERGDNFSCQKYKNTTDDHWHIISYNAWCAIECLAIF